MTIDFSHHSFFLYILRSTEVNEPYVHDAPDLETYPVEQRAEVNRRWRVKLSEDEIMECRVWRFNQDAWAASHEWTEDRDLNEWRTLNSLWPKFKTRTKCRQYTSWTGKTHFWSCGMWSCDLWSQSQLTCCQLTMMFGDLSSAHRF